MSLSDRIAVLEHALREIQQCAGQPARVHRLACLALAAAKPAPSAAPGVES